MIKENTKTGRGNVLVTGGAGYIGAHTVKALLDAGYGLTVYDDLSRGHPEQIPGVSLVIGQTEDQNAMNDLFSTRSFDAVIHLAAESLVGESVANPHKYFKRNVMGGLTLFGAMVKHGVKKVVMSSSAGVYGQTETVPITEDFPLNPESPYGDTKVCLEKALSWYHGAYGLQSVSLRYFNAAGADSEGRMGEDHDPETHLIPLAINAVISGKPLTLFGQDYPTPDGTNIRDYVHVTDLAHAHLLSLEYLESGGTGVALNIGTEQGYSVLEIINAIQSVTGKKVPYEVGPRRPGDPAALVASYQKAKSVLGWEPRHSNIEEIIETAWKWHKKAAR